MGSVVLSISLLSDVFQGVLYLVLKLCGVIFF